MSDPFRVYEPSECGRDSYPLAWHSIDGGPGVKHLVREEAGHRCVRCAHPFVCGATPGAWSPCDSQCEHGGPVRVRWWQADAFSEWHDVGDATPLSVQTSVAHGAEVEAASRVLTVHHLRLGNDAKRDLRWWNLAALCQRCHLTIQGKVQMERVWPWPHSDWFQPYAAGWYAWTYLGEDLTREQVMARLPELLSLELAA